MNTGKAVLGVLAGVAVGAILGILIAPDKGSETRRKISQKGSDTVDDVKNKIAGLLDGISDKFEVIQDEKA
ncbi:MAG: YtxH domain-containing protein [Crocinitomicaceae bacterium]|nr:YtxH domain-containing protein [Crocinitomicaceae bacterium]